MAAPWTFVVPVGPGDASWRVLLADLDGAFDDCEVLVVFAEGHLPEPPPRQARCIMAPVGRAHQLNAGIAAASYARVCLVHADSRLSPEALQTLLAFDPGPTELAFFDLRFHDGPRWMWLNSVGTWLRSRCLGLPFGDQGFAARRTLFERLGGFDPEVGAGEDHALVWRLRRDGGRLRPLGAVISTSARRYVEHGWWTTTAGVVRMTILQACAFARRRDAE